MLDTVALARIRRPEQLRHHPPGELGKTIGLDRIPEARSLREKIAQLAADPQLHRFIVIFDLEGSHHSLLTQLWEKRIGAITYRKNVTDTWPESEFIDTQVPRPGGQITPMRLATRQTQITARNAPPVPVTEVRRLTPSGHQTAVITTARNLDSPVIAGRMFSRWCQENHFGYMMEHYDIDGLIQYGSEEMDGTIRLVNPA